MGSIYEDRMHMKTLIIPLVFATLANLLAAELRLPKVFSDHMVLQRDQSLPVWGWADPGTEVAVHFKSQRAKTTAGEDGKWMLELKAEPAEHQPQVLRIVAGKEQVSLQNVLVGEVWICSGQSNMGWRVNRSLDGDIDVASAHLPNIRLYQVERKVSDQPRETTDAVWQISTPQTLENFSAVAYHFGRTLNDVLNVPIGLIHSSWGGTPAISWTRMEAILSHPLLTERKIEWDEGMPVYAERYAAWQEEFAAWKASKNLTDADGPFNRRLYPDYPNPPNYDPMGSHRPATLFNGMIAPLIPYAIRGAIWYQGENDTHWQPKRYDERLEVMIRDWRSLWNNPQLYFGIVQLAGYGSSVADPENDTWPDLRESQRLLAARLEHAGQAVTIDIGESNDIHPVNKWAVGRRLARLALHDIFGKLEVRGGPEFDRAEFSDESVLVHFTQTGKRLHAFSQRELSGFTIAGEDGVFQPATATIESPTTVRVSAEGLRNPQSVRYAWLHYPADANLFNVERLPASPFQANRE